MHERKINNKQKTINSLLSLFIIYYLLFIARCAKPVGYLCTIRVKLTVLCESFFESFLSVDKLGGFTRVFTLAIHKLTHNLKLVFISINGRFLLTIHNTYKNNNEIIKFNYLLLIKSCV